LTPGYHHHHHHRHQIQSAKVPRSTVIQSRPNHRFDYEHACVKSKAHVALAQIISHLPWARKPTYESQNALKWHGRYGFDTSNLSDRCETDTPRHKRPELISRRRTTGTGTGTLLFPSGEGIGIETEKLHGGV
jgi:hypothetical protein